MSQVLREFKTKHKQALQVVVVLLQISAVQFQQTSSVYSRNPQMTSRRLLWLFLRPGSPRLCVPRLQSVLDSVEIEATSTLGLPTCPAVLAVRPPYEAVAPKRQTTPQPCPPILPIEKSDLFRQRTLLTVTKPKKSECREGPLSLSFTPADRPPSESTGTGNSGLAASRPVLPSLHRSY